MTRSHFTFAIALIAAFVVVPSLLAQASPTEPTPAPKNTVAAWSARKYFLTKTQVQGNQALQACLAVPGYHMASLWEIYNVSTLQYDTTNGLTSGDSGSGPPTMTNSGAVAHGWVRTGAMTAVPNEQGDEGTASCNGWTSNSSSVTGSAVTLHRLWSPNAAYNQGNIGPWGFENRYYAPFACSSSQYVWCVQD
jgi:hypothetical protein